MQKFKKALLTTLSMVLVAVIAVVSTMAYLADDDSDVNVMTLGNVSIEQHEYQRATNEDGTYKTATIDNMTSYVLEDFEQAKPLLPATESTNNGAGPWDSTRVRMTQVGSYGTMDVFTSENAQDKFVTVENTGKTDAYVRTLVAVECGSTDGTLVGTSYHTNWGKNAIGIITIDSNNYYLVEYTYKGASDNSRHVGGVLPAGETSYPNLSQVYIKSTATNEDMEAIDGNDNGTLDILVFSQAVQAAGFDDAATALDAAFGDITTTAHPWSGTAPKIPTVVSNAEELTEALTTASDAKSGDNTIYLTEDITLTEDWEPISVDGYYGAGIVTIEGQGNTITGLTAPLFAGGFAGESGIVIRDLTIADSEIKSDSTQGAGAFVASADSMTTITLENCHLLNSTVDAPKARTGGLVGWTSGFSEPDNGPVKSYVTITDCSVINCTITGTAVGGINGHAGASDWTYTTIENCTVMNNKLISYDEGDWRVGAVVGTANIGEVTIKGTVSGGNTMTQEKASSQRAEGLSDLVGRFVPGTTGKLTVEGTVQAATAAKQEELNEAVKSGADVISLSDGTYTIPDVSNTSYKIVGTGDDVVVDQSAAVVTRTNTDIVFENVTIKGTSDNYKGLQAGNVVYNNCVFEGGNHLYSKSVTFNTCTFNLTSQYITTYGATTITFNTCTWNTDGKALLVFQDGDSVDQVVTVKDNTFNATTSAYTWNKIQVAAVSIDGSAPTTNGTFVVNFEGNNVVDDDFAGLCQIKGEKGNVTVTGATPSDLVYKAE